MQRDEKFRDFHLAGGTALAFHLGHRESIDIDQNQDWPKMLKEKDLNLKEIKRSITCSINKYLSNRLPL
ncbi:MAG: nucleotidyl transferase AbiEii/AbiGii toxin family protein [Bacteroidales bacterium]|nr:nucleotidyl transferase AbiEii/AbiGii toxin family protein [Bacteroidales bacterium]